MSNWEKQHILTLEKLEAEDIWPLYQFKYLFLSINSFTRSWKDVFPLAMKMSWAHKINYNMTSLVISPYRKTKANTTTRILIHLVVAMFLLNFTFLINNFVANVKNSLACKIMAAFMHCFMLATFSWFAAHAFHLCLQLHTGGKIVIHRYILKLCITTWGELMPLFYLLFGLTVNVVFVINILLIAVNFLSSFPVIPSIVGIVLLVIGKYGEQVISTDNTADNVAMWVGKLFWTLLIIYRIIPDSHVWFLLLTCPSVPRCWITDINVHYIVNIGYYALVFLFTLTAFIIIVSWLVCLKRSKGGTVQVNRNSRSIVTILGLCCMLGVTWGFAFFAYGVIRIPAYYIFTVLNSFQGDQSGNAPTILDNNHSI